MHFLWGNIPKTREISLKHHNYFRKCRNSLFKIHISECLEYLAELCRGQSWGCTMFEIYAHYHFKKGIFTLSKMMQQIF